MTLDEENEYAHYLAGYTITLSGGSIQPRNNASLRCMAATAIGAAHAKGIPGGTMGPPGSWIYVKPEIDAMFPASDNDDEDDSQSK